MLIDIGLNLSSERYDADREAVLERARAAGVTACLLTGTSLEESLSVLALARRYPGCHATAGVHPHEAASFTPAVEAALRELLQQPEIVAVGETGLDFNRNYSPPAAQEAALLAQLGLATETGLPLFLHERDASTRMRDILQTHDISHGVLHCFTGNREALWAYLDRGLYIGITGWVCDERRGQELQALVKEIPGDRLLLESDGPWLLPRDLPAPPKNKRNEPAFLPHIAARVAALRGESVAALAAQTTANARRLFNIPP